MRNADELTEIAEHCQRVAVILRRVAENDNLQQDTIMMQAILTLKK